MQIVIHCTAAPVCESSGSIRFLLRDVILQMQTPDVQLKRTGNLSQTATANVLSKHQGYWKWSNIASGFITFKLNEFGVQAT